MAADTSITIHGTTIARRGSAALLQGPSGAGKSDLALRALTMPLQLPGEESPVLFQLISDDQTMITRTDNMLLASPPTTIAGLLEVRGIGIVDMSHHVDFAPLLLIATLSDGQVERLPQPEDETTTWLGLEIMTVVINPFEASAPAKLALALSQAENQR